MQAAGILRKENLSGTLNLIQTRTKNHGREGGEGGGEEEEKEKEKEGFLGEYWRR